MATEIVFNPELTEEEWLAPIEWILSPDNPRTIEDHFCAMWKSKPWLKPLGELDRKEMLLMVAFYQEMAPLIIHPEARELLRVAELFADDERMKSLMSQANQAVDDLGDGPHLGTKAEQRALETVSWIWCKPSDAVLGIPWFAGLAHARSCGDQNNSEYQAVGGETCFAKMVDLIRCVYGNPFRPTAFSPSWQTEHTTSIAAKMYEDRDFVAMPILADALEEAGCDNVETLTHCREPGVHVRGCWVVDLVLGKS